MKTKTGLTIIHDGERVNVYTPQEIEALKNQNKFISAYKSILKHLGI
jgi:hypothetical protein|tara:strand:- start:559 stop:699 length:141 start_codon:yes stop_codon:yes gene_type:complete